MGLLSRAHAALLVDDVALLVELAHHRLEEALGLQVGPQLEAIGRERVEVAGLVGGSCRRSGPRPPRGRRSRRTRCAPRSVSASAIASFQAFSSSVDLLVVAAHGLAARRVVGGVGLLDLLQRGLLGARSPWCRCVSVPLKAMCSNMWARPVIPGTSWAAPTSTWVKNEKTGRLRPLADDQAEPVVEDLDRDPLLEGGQVLGGREPGGGDEQAARGQGPHGRDAHVSSRISFSFGISTPEHIRRHDRSHQRAAVAQQLITSLRCFTCRPSYRV